MTKWWCRRSPEHHSNLAVFQLSPSQENLLYLCLYPDAWAKTLKVILLTSSFMPPSSSLNPNNSTNKTCQFHPLLPISAAVIPGQLTIISCLNNQNSCLEGPLTSSNSTCHYTSSNPCSQEICLLHLKYNAKALPRIARPLIISPSILRTFLFFYLLRCNYPGL